MADLLKDARAAGFNRAQLVEALRLAGVQEGGVVYSHVALGFLGRPHPAASTEETARLLWDAMWDVLGGSGTWVVPAFTYSCGKNETFDPIGTPATTGFFSEFFRKRNVVRSQDPMLSMAAAGRQAEALVCDLPARSYGKGTLYERLLGVDARLCNIGTGLGQTTFLHHVECEAAVPYRFTKKFTGRLSVAGVTRDIVWEYHARVRIPETLPALDRLERTASEDPAFRRAAAGAAGVVSLPLRRLETLCRTALARDPWFLVQGPALSAEALERKKRETELQAGDSA